MEEQQICQLFITRKKRQCKFPAVKGSKYCAAHCSDLEGKIQCPFEKGLFISVAKYQKHLQHCPKIKNRLKEETSEWFNKDVNKMDENVEEEHIQYVPSLSEVCEEDLNRIVRKIIEMYKRQIDPEDQLVFISSYELQCLDGTTKDHLQAQLITRKAFDNKLISPQLIYVEFGAGKGVLSYAIANKIEEQFKKHSKNVLLERESRRKKFDRYFKDNPYFQRYKGDVSNFDFKILPKIMAKYATQKCKLQTQLEEIQKQIMECELIGVCKHMCGEALDISVRGLLQGNSKGCILASCCHHRCNYNTYLNPKFFDREGLTPDEIQILFRVSSWGTKSHKFEEISASIFQELLGISSKNLSMQQKILIGRMCKRLIDVGRAQFLDGKLFRYCSDQLTPENYVIIAKN